MKHYIAVGLIIVVALIVGFDHFASKVPTENLSGISRTVSYSSATVATSTFTQVLSVNPRAKYRRIQQDTNATVYCFAAASSTLSTTPAGIRLTQGQSYEWRGDQGNLWPGAISCKSITSTSSILTEEHYE